MNKYVGSTGGIIPTGTEWRTKILAEKPVPVPLCPSQIPQELACVQTPASAVTGSELPGEPRHSPTCNNNNKPTSWWCYSSGQWSCTVTPSVTYRHKAPGQYSGHRYYAMR